MGLLSRAKKAIGSAGGIEEDNGTEEEDWMEEVNSEVSAEEEEMEMSDDFEEESEPEVREWDSAYQFAGEYIEVRGFTSMVDFTNKAMAHKVNQSPMFRDRLQNGVQTMDRISHMQQQLQQIKGGNSQSRSFKDQAEELKAANEVIDQAEKLNGKEDAMVNEAMNLGYELVDKLGQNATNMAQTGSVESNVQTKNEEM